MIRNSVRGDIVLQQRTSCSYHFHSYYSFACKVDSIPHCTATKPKKIVMSPQLWCDLIWSWCHQHLFKAAPKLTTQTHAISTDFYNDGFSKPKVNPVEGCFRREESHVSWQRFRGTFVVNDAIDSEVFPSDVGTWGGPSEHSPMQDALGWDVESETPSMEQGWQYHPSSPFWPTL